MGGPATHDADQPGERGVTLETVGAIAQSAGLPLSEEELALIATTLSSQIASMSTIDRLDLSEIEPLVRFDPRWE